MRFWSSLSSVERGNFILTCFIGLLTVINVIATIVYVRTFIKASAATTEQTEKLISAANIQVGAANKMADAAQTQATKMTELAGQATTQAIATNSLARQAERSADIAAQSLQVNRELSQEDRRAWVSAEIGDRAGKFFIAMHNTGKTPAINVTYVAAFSPGKLGVVPEVDLTTNSSSPIVTNNLPPQIVEELKKQGTIPSHPPTGYVIAPGKSEISSYFGAQFDRIFGFPPDQRMYIQGRFTYEDIFGRKHETRFCFWYASPVEFPMCTDHNYMN
jgi:hypothetical protein